MSQIPRSQRRRTIVCPLTTGHFAGLWVPSIRGVIQNTVGGGFLGEVFAKLIHGIDAMSREQLKS
jgi:hypothetical protein